LVIFDCDGVLVDSEPLALGLLVDSLDGIGIKIDLADAQRRFLGRSLTAVCEMIREDFGVSVPEDTLSHMRTELNDLFRRELKPIEGVAAMLGRLEPARCVASSSQPDRIRLSLRVTGLLDHFKPNIFSATMVKRGKPAPDLFLFAASRMGVAPEAVLVIEDSPAGIVAARRAGMHAFGFTGGSHAFGAEHGQGLRKAGAHLIFSSMGSLPDHINSLSD